MCERKLKNRFHEDGVWRLEVQKVCPVVNWLWVWVDLFCSVSEPAKHTKRKGAPDRWLVCWLSLQIVLKLLVISCWLPVRLPPMIDWLVMSRSICRNWVGNWVHEATRHDTARRGRSETEPNRTEYEPRRPNAWQMNKLCGDCRHRANYNLSCCQLISAVLLLCSALLWAELSWAHNLKPCAGVWLGLCLLQTRREERREKGEEEKEERKKRGESDWFFHSNN